MEPSVHHSSVHVGGKLLKLAEWQLALPLALAFAALFLRRCCCWWA